MEDDETIRDTVQLALEFNNFPVVTANNGREGLELLPKMEKPGLILLDMMMPELDGWGFLEAVHKNPELAEIPVVAMTAAGVKPEPLPVNGMLTKPINLRELMKVAHDYCA